MPHIENLKCSAAAAEMEKIHVSQRILVQSQTTAHDHGISWDVLCGKG